jgi:hypothetical protein
VVPLFGLVGVFHYTDSLPAVAAEGKWVKDGVERFGRYARRKGWLGEEEVRGAEIAVREDQNGGEGLEGRQHSKRARIWGTGELGVRLLVE